MENFANTNNVNITDTELNAFDIQKFSAEDIFGASINNDTNSIEFDIQNFATTTDSASAVIKVEESTDSVTYYNNISDISNITTGTVTLISNTTISSDIAFGSQLHIGSNVTLTVSGGTIKFTSSQTNKALITVDNGGTLTMTGGTIDGLSATTTYAKANNSNGIICLCHFT